MNKFLLIILLVSFLTVNLYSQEIDSKPFSSKKRFSLSVGMGLSLLNTPSFNEYLRNVIPYVTKDSIKTFSLGLEFFGSAEYGASKNISLRLDYSYFIKSVSYQYYYLVYDYFYNIHQPALNVFYLISGKHYQFKFGGGAAFQFIKLERKISNDSNLIYKSNGIGLRGEMIYSAQLSDKLSSYISGFIFGNLSGSLRDAESNALTSPNSGKEVNLDGFGIGTRLGISLYLN